MANLAQEGQETLTKALRSLPITSGHTNAYCFTTPVFDGVTSCCVRVCVVFGCVGGVTVIFVWQTTPLWAPGIPVSHRRPDLISCCTCICSHTLPLLASFLFSYVLSQKAKNTVNGWSQAHFPSYDKSIAAAGGAVSG